MTLANSTAFAARWQFHYMRRKAAQKLQTWRRTVDGLERVPADANVLLVTIPHELAETQIYPFHFYRHHLQKAGIRFVQLTLDSVLNSGATGVAGREVKRIFFQPEFEMPADKAKQALQKLSQAFPSAKIAFMDWFAPLHVHQAKNVDQYIDVYIKKQVFRELSNFSNQVKGDTNLSDYYARQHGLSYSEMTPDLPAGFDEKIRLWSNFGLSPQMVDLFLGPMPNLDNRDIDLHARLAVNGEPWYRAMRQEAKDAVDGLSGITIAQHGRVRRDEFFAEMARSKMCFSPFGYGEVCWRDYEAMATGALLIKPSMDHVSVEPNVFIPDETFISVKWDLSDFSEAINANLQNDAKRRKICAAGFHQYQEWIRSAAAAKDIIELVG